jgi:nucleoside-diphosphate-sugar epimerase
MTVLVTGVAGFVGSHLARKLLEQGHRVIGLDSFTDFYPKWMKEKNLEPLQGNGRFEFLARDLNLIDGVDLLRRTEAVYHLAAQPGVRTSWGRNFEAYIRNNIQNTQVLLEAAKESQVAKFIFASSSSVYGLTPDLPMKESSPLCPLSPYGVTKLAAEQLCILYHKNFGLPTVSLRFFTVYGPGQRPDMAFHRFFKAILQGGEIIVYGDGSQTRDFTYVADIVEACLAALERGRPGEVYNLGGGHRQRLEDIFPLVEEVCRKSVRRRTAERQSGDVPDTLADITKAQADLGFSPRTDLRGGLSEEWAWLQALYQT